jgi:hypothetical protein
MEIALAPIVAEPHPIVAELEQPLEQHGRSSGSSSSNDNRPKRQQQQQQQQQQELQQSGQPIAKQRRLRGPPSWLKDSGTPAQNIRAWHAGDEHAEAARSTPLLAICDVVDAPSAMVADNSADEVWHIDEQVDGESWCDGLDELSP